MASWTTTDWLSAIAISLAGLLMYVTSIGPEKAVSHIAEWVKPFGVRNPPPWLASTETDRVVRHVAALVVLFGGSLLLIQNLNMAAIHPLSKILFGIAVVALAISIVTNLIQPKLVEQIQHPAFLIVIGALIALIGAIWMWRATPSIAALQSTVTAQGNEIQRLKLERITTVATLPPATSNAPSPGPLTPVAINPTAPNADLAMKIARRDQLRVAIEDVKRQREHGETAFEKLKAHMQSRPPREPTAEETARVPMARTDFEFRRSERGNLKHMYESNIRGILQAFKAVHDKMFDEPLEPVTTEGILDNLKQQVPGEKEIESEVEGYEYRKAWYIWRNGKTLIDGLIRRMEAEVETLNRDVQKVNTRPIAEK